MDAAIQPVASVDDIRIVQSLARTIWFDHYPGIISWAQVHYMLERGYRVAVAESCTGGLIASRLTDVPGSSRYVDRGVVVYANQAKTDLLGVPERLIAEHGAVSEPVALAMADGIRVRSRTDVGIGVTGIAGPDGGTPDKPVGTVAVAAAIPAATRVCTFRFTGDRELVKFQASQAALDMLRRLLLA